MFGMLEYPQQLLDHAGMPCDCSVVPTINEQNSLVGIQVSVYLVFN